MGELIGNLESSRARIATDKKTGVQRAVKTIKKSELQNLSEVGRNFDYLKSLKHPNLCEIIGFFEDEYNYY